MPPPPPLPPPTPTDVHHGPDEVPFGWYYLEEMNAWSRVKYPAGVLHPARDFLTKQILNPDNSDLMSVKLAKAITDPKVTCLFLEWLDSLDADLNRWGVPPAGTPADNPGV